MLLTIATDMSVADDAERPRRRLERITIFRGEQSAEVGGC
jgi:hypothetical protein